MHHLFQTASNSICIALSTGRSLSHLLGLSKEQGALDSATQSDDIVTAVFSHVLNDEEPPEKLSRLVIHAMAKALDSDTWNQLKHSVNHNIARQLITAMVAHKELKCEKSIDDGTIVKFEDCAAGENVQSAMIEARRGSNIPN